MDRKSNDPIHTSKRSIWHPSITDGRSRFAFVCGVTRARLGKPTFSRYKGSSAHGCAMVSSAVVLFFPTGKVVDSVHVVLSNGCFIGLPETVTIDAIQPQRLGYNKC